MKVVGSTCALKSSKVGGDADVVRCLSEQSLAIGKCKLPLLDEHMSMFLQDMNSCYSKLKELVPTLPTNKKASKVEILQHVIDYIFDLQIALEAEGEDAGAAAAAASSGAAPKVLLSIKVSE